MTAAPQEALRNLRVLKEGPEISVGVLVVHEGVPGLKCPTEGSTDSCGISVLYEGHSGTGQKEAELFDTRVQMSVTKFPVFIKVI